MQSKLTTFHLPQLYFAKLTQMSSDELQNLLTSNPKEAAIWVRMAAVQGLDAAQLRLGRMLLAGEGLEKNAQEAFFWFTRAAVDGDADALNMLGRCFENGWGVAANPAQAFAHYHRAAELGNDWAQYNLGHCYLDGNGTPRDPYRAFYWYAKAAGQGHGRAMNLLARCYEEGWGIERDVETAHDWYRQSAESGYFRGQYNWASLLANAEKTDEAAEWFLLAAKNGTQNVRRTVATVLLESSHPTFKAYGLTVLEFCCENGDALDFQRYGQALLHGLAGKPEPEKAAYWLKRAAEFE
jgi:TPR repeat protein